MELSRKMSKKETNETEMKVNALAHIAEQGGGKTEIYTDGSKNDEGRVGGAFYVKQTNVKENFRISDNTSIFTAELISIIRALKYLENSGINEAIILTDSLSVVQALETGATTTNANLLRKARYQITEMAGKGRNLEVHWIPSHVGIAGNEVADQLAKLSLTKDIIDEETKPQLHETYANIDRIIDDVWQARWNDEQTGRQYHRIQPTVSRNIKFSDRNNRLKEATLTKLRLGRSGGLRFYKHQMGKTDDSKCTTCNTDETVQHFLTNCTKNISLHNELTNICQTRALELNIKTILNDHQCLETIYRYIRQHNIDI